MEPRTEKEDLGIKAAGALWAQKHACRGKDRDMQILLLGHQRAIERILVTALLLSHVLDESLTRSRDKKG